jgi:hypothetical protein
VKGVFQLSSSCEKLLTRIRHVSALAQQLEVLHRSDVLACREDERLSRLSFSRALELRGGSRRLTDIGSCVLASCSRTSDGRARPPARPHSRRGAALLPRSPSTPPGTASNDVRSQTAGSPVPEDPARHTHALTPHRPHRSEFSPCRSHVGPHAHPTTC